MPPCVKSSSFLRPVVLALVVCLLVGTSSLFGQVIRIEAGTSDILPSRGGSINVQGENYEGYLGAGDVGGAFRFGSYVKTSFDGYKFTLGDQTTVVGLPTDIFNSQQYFLARGGSVSGQFHNAKVFVFGGATALGIGSQFFQAASTQVPIGMLFVDIPVSDKLAFYSRNLGSMTQTSIQGVNWRPLKWLNTALSAGIGGNQPYAATTLSVHQDWIDLKTGYIQAGDRFRRITTPSVFAAEPDRENILVTLKPISNLVLNGGHENLLQPQADLNAPFIRASVDQFQSSYTVAKFRLGAGVFHSSSQLFHNLGEDFSVSRPITRNIEAGVNYFRTLSGSSTRSDNLSGTIREKITQKLSLLQIVTRSEGNTNVLFGGSYTTNRFAVSVDYQTLYLPFLPANPFQQGLSVSLRVKLFGNFQVNADTFRSPDGKLRYSAGANTLLVHNFQHGGNANQTFNFPKYVVRGHVRDEAGAPIEGAALRIGDEIVYSNAMGEFLARRKTAGQLRFEVVLPEFQNALTFTIIAAPATVTAGPEDSAHDVLVVLSPVFRKKTSSTPTLPPARNPAPASPSPSQPAPAVPATPELRGSGNQNEISKAQPLQPQIHNPGPAAPPQSAPAPPKAQDAHVANSTSPISKAQPLAKQVQNPAPLAPPAQTPATPHVAPDVSVTTSANQVSSVSKYVIRGHVQDENGTPLAGVTIPIGDEVVSTDSHGGFMLRQNKAVLFSLAAAFEGRFRVVSAPPMVLAGPEASARDILIVLAPASPDHEKTGSVIRGGTL